MLKQIAEGTVPGEGVESELLLVFERAEIVAVLPVRPGLARYGALLARIREVLAERKARADEEAETWPRPFRLKPGFRHAGPSGDDLEAGETAMLTKAQARAFADRFEA
jgi:hypothetical protein